jgi:uncharacterized membrane protein YfcA
MLLLALGFLGGFLNAAASSGSAITLPALLYLGIPPSIANATNRIPVVIGFIASTYNFHKAKLINWKRTLLLATSIGIGAIMGVFFAEKLNNNSIKWIIDLALVVSFTLAITKFKKLTFKRDKPLGKITPFTHLFFLFTGVWGGLIVLDTATFILFILTLNLSMDIIEANAMKSALCLILSLISLIIFGFSGEINWIAGLTISVGSLLGGYFGSKFAISEKSRIWIFRLLISAIGLELLSMTYKLLNSKF